MILSKEIQDTIKILFKNNPIMKEKLLSLDPDAIREIGSTAQRGIPFEDVIDAYESKDPQNLEYLYNKAKRQASLQKLYNDLCYAYYEANKNTKTLK